MGIVFYFALKQLLLPLKRGTSFCTEEIILNSDSVFHYSKDDLFFYVVRSSLEPETGNVKNRSPLPSVKVNVTPSLSLSGLDRHAAAIITNAHHMPPRRENVTCDRSALMNRKG